MSFLAPLYALGALAISLPILLHLIRRTPRGRIAFSSLMFLTPSPPRITRRSRLEHLLLLLMRATAILLLALAFARPFFRETAQLGLLTARDRQIALLIDTSASMRREPIWNNVQQQAEEVLRKLAAGDEVGLFTFDDRLRTLVGFDQSSTDLRARIATMRQQLTDLRPGWSGSNLGDALASLADQMDSDADRQQSDAVLQIHLFTDMQEGVQLESLQNFEWPSRVYVQVHVVESKPGNAGLQEIMDLDQTLSGTWRVRVSNDANGTQDEFALQWLDADGAPLPELAADKVYVPAGQDRVLRLTPPEGREVSTLCLVGDPHEFDNKLYLSHIKPPPIRVLYAGHDAADDVRGMRYYLQQALESDPRRTVDYSAMLPGELNADALQDLDLLVLAAAPPQPVLETIRHYAAAGGWIVAALPTVQDSAVLGELLGLNELNVREAELSGYAMLSEIDFDHPLFARLADARYSDFTKIRFWKMRELALPSADENLHVLASFDNHLPALVQQAIGRGGCLVWASTWSRDDSQLALSTKFIPLVSGLLSTASPLPEQPARKVVGQVIELSAPFDVAHPVAFQASNEQVQELSLDDLQMLPLERPGHYRTTQGTSQQLIAVNIKPEESRTTSLDPESLEQFGVRLGKAVRPEDDAERQRQLRDQELEKRQQVWRWLIAAALGVLVAETWVAGHYSRRSTPQET